MNEISNTVFRLRFAKKYGISLRCAKKMDALKALPPEGLAELESK
jgi:hypothetical protein